MPETAKSVYPILYPRTLLIIALQVVEDGFPHCGKHAHDVLVAPGHVHFDRRILCRTARRGVLRKFSPSCIVGAMRPVAKLPALNGRDHNHYGFTCWLAGGGTKGGTVIGATDEFGFKAVENPVHVHDLHATMLHLLGFDHEKLTYRYAGRDFRLTDVHGKVINAMLA